jgi:uncharacterized cupin superfamily protein
MRTPRELLKAETTNAMEAKSKTHDLNDNAIRSSKLLEDATGLTNLGVHLMTVMPGREASEYHRHHYEEECYYILSGSGEVVIDNAPHAVGAGDFIGFPANGLAHTLKNTSNEPLTFLAVRHRLEQDVCDYPRKGLRLYMNGPEEAFISFSDVLNLKKPSTPDGHGDA